MDDAASRCHTGMCPDGCLLRAAGDATYGPICLGVETATGNFFGRVGGRWTDLSSQGPSPLSQVTPSLDRKRRSGQAGETRQGQGFTAKPRAQGLASAAVSSSHGSSAWNLHDRRPNGLILTPRPEKTRHPSLVNFTWLSRAGPDPDGCGGTDRLHRSRSRGAPSPVQSFFSLCGIVWTTAQSADPGSIAIQFSLPETGRG